jgi:hypothetical protein
MLRRVRERVSLDESAITATSSRRPFDAAGRPYDGGSARVERSKLILHAQ